MWGGKKSENTKKDNIRKRLTNPFTAPPVQTIKTSGEIHEKAHQSKQKKDREKDIGWFKRFLSAILPFMKQDCELYKKCFLSFGSEQVCVVLLVILEEPLEDHPKISVQQQQKSKATKTTKNKPCRRCQQRPWRPSWPPQPPPPYASPQQPCAPPQGTCREQPSRQPCGSPTWQPTRQPSRASR